MEAVLTSIGTDQGYRGTAADKCVRYDVPTKKLVFDNNQDFCYKGVDIKPVCKKKLGKLWNKEVSYFIFCIS